MTKDIRQELDDDFWKSLEIELEGNSSNFDAIKAKERFRLMWQNYKGDDRIVTSQEILEELDKQEPQVGISTGFSELDKITGTLYPEQLIILSAQEKTGKTTFGLQMIGNMPEMNPCCFLFEQSPHEIVRQMKVRGQVVPHFVTPLKNADNRIIWLQERCLEAMVKYDSKVFLIDNADWLEREYTNRALRSDEIIKDLLLKLKRFCIEWKITIILIAHVRKADMKEIPQPNDIKDTVAFKQIADTVLILWRKVKEEKVEGTKTKAPYRTNETLCWVAENRRFGRTGYVQMVFDGKRFEQKVWDSVLESYGKNDVDF